MKNNVLPPRFSDVQLKTGVRLRYREQGDPAAPPLILLHGYTDSSFSFSRVLPLLAESFRVFALDQRGHGDSERPENGYALTDFAADVIAFMDAIGAPRAAVVGHCMGSFVAQQAALVAPERVARLVLIASAASPRKSGMYEFQQAVESLSDPVPEQFAREFQESTLYQALPREFVDAVVGESLKLPARVWHAALGGLLAAEYPLPLGRIKVPALVLWGDKDSIFDSADQESLMKLLPDALLKVYPETGHSPHWERPREFAEALREFLAGLGAEVGIYETAEVA